MYHSSVPVFLNYTRLLSLSHSQSHKISDKIAFPIVRNQTHKIAMTDTYEEAVDCMNSLQSNQSYIQDVAKKGILPHSVTFSTTIAETQKYLLRTGVSLNDLDKLSIIHVAGTKGKGSTCAFCDSILREYGYKTGFYSSPHLVAIRERIRLNGKPLSKDAFAANFFRIYKLLMDARDHPNDMPGYFRFLTVLAFNIFLRENVDVAILEVGIGGEFDCTNVVRNTPVVGITNLGIDHTSLLGNTIEQIAWQKAGIMKKNSKSFTVAQHANAMRVLKERSIEKESSLHLIPRFEEYQWDDGGPPVLGINAEVQKINASLAIQLSHTWLTLNGIDALKQKVPEKTKRGLENCKWPGRNQILRKSNQTFFLDGAHTEDSLKICANWFKHVSTQNSHKVLVFNATGDRNSEQLLHQLDAIHFNIVCFVPNVGTVKKVNAGKHQLAASVKKLAHAHYNVIDQTNLVNTNEQQLKRCEAHKNIWLNSRKNRNQIVSVHSSVEDAVCSLPVNVSSEILITGSLHLVGAALDYLDPELHTF